MNVKLICGIRMYGGSACVQVWSAQNAVDGHFQPCTSTQTNPNPDPDPNPSGGSRSARGRQGQSCHTYTINMHSLMNVTRTSKKPCCTYVRVFTCGVARSMFTYAVNNTQIVGLPPGPECTGSTATAVLVEGAARVPVI